MDGEICQTSELTCGKLNCICGIVFEQCRNEWKKMKGNKRIGNVEYMRIYLITELNSLWTLWSSKSIKNC